MWLFLAKPLLNAKNVINGHSLYVLYEVIVGKGGHTPPFLDQPPFSKIPPFLEVQDVPTFHRFIG